MIEKMIEEAKRRPDTAENLNYLGDLYLRKGDRLTAIACYYDAAEKLHFAQKEKKIAIYKKIIKVSPGEERAYEQLIFLFAKMGLAADEKHYLLELIRLYQGMGEYNKINSIFRRVLEIDPKNEIAESFFRKGKLDIADQNETSRAEPIKAGRSLPEASDESPVSDRSDIPIIHPPVGKTPEEPALGDDNSSALPPVFDASLNQKSDTRRLRKIIGGVAAVLVVVGVIFLGRGMRKEGPRTGDQGRQAGTGKTVEQRLLAEKTVGGYVVTVSAAPKPRTSTPGIDASSLLVYRIGVNAITGCLPDRFVSDPYLMVSFMQPDGRTVAPADLKELKNELRVVYRANRCNRDSAPVYIAFAVAGSRSGATRGLAIQGLGDAGTIEVGLNGDGTK